MSRKTKEQLLTEIVILGAAKGVVTPAKVLNGFSYKTLSRISKALINEDMKKKEKEQLSKLLIEEITKQENKRIYK